MIHSIHSETPDARKARIVLECVMKLSSEGLSNDFFTTKMIWGVLNYLAFGKFATHRWNTYERLSNEALRIKRDEGPGWRKQVTYEHPQPIKIIHERLIAEGRTLTLDRAAEIVGEYHPVIISRQENKAIDKRGHKTHAIPEERYQDIPLAFLLASNKAKQ